MVLFPHPEHMSNADLKERLMFLAWLVEGGELPPHLLTEIGWLKAERAFRLFGPEPSFA